MDPNPSGPTPNAGDQAPEKALAALSLRSADLLPDFVAGTEIEEDADDQDDDEEEEEYLTAASRGGSSTVAWKEEMEGPLDEEDTDAGLPSPTSSGYPGERGSSLASSGGGIEEPPDTQPGAQDWPRDKKHRDEDDASASWRKRKKHFFILSNSGKPIYSRYGDEHRLAGFLLRCKPLFPLLRTVLTISNL